MSTMKISNGSESIEGILARDVRVSLRKEMRRLYYTPRTLAKGVGIPYRTIKFWLEGQGVISQDQYLAICKHLAIDHLNGAGFSREEVTEKVEDEVMEKCQEAAEPRSVVEQRLYGECLLFGRGVRQNREEAHKWICKAAESGDFRAQIDMSFMALHGIGCGKDELAAVLWLDWAAESRAKECAKCEEKEAVSAEPKQGEANFAELVEEARRAFIDEDWEEAIKLARKTGPEDADLQSWMGNSYEYGRGVEKNLAEAFKWYKKSAGNGCVQAQCELGSCYENGKGTEKNLADAFKWYLKAAENGDAHGQCCVAKMFEDGQGVTKDEAKAFYWYKKAAENGNGWGQHEVGCCYECGKGTEKNLSEAFKWYLKSAEDELELAISEVIHSYELGRKIGHMYEFGLGTEKNLSEALYWYKKAADIGDEDAKKCLERMEKKLEEELVSNAIAAFKANKWNEAFELARKTGLKDAVLQSWMGYCYECGNGVEKNLKEAFKWYEKSALNGSGWSQCRLGYSYEYGNGTERNYEKALEWYAKAAEQGNNCAQCNLGLMFEYGRGVPIGLATAFQWYKKSAESGWAVGKYRLGLCYETGKGVAIDVEAARGWYKKAAYDGNEDAKKALLRLDEEQNKVANLNHVVASNPQSTCGHGRKLRKPTKRNAINEMYRYITKIMIEEYEIKDIEFDDVDDYLYAVEVPNDTDEDILMDASNLFFHEIGILEDERDLELEEETEYCTVHRNEHSGKYFVIFNHPFVIDAKAAGEMVGDTVREFVEATRKRLAENEARESDGDEDNGDEAWMRELADGIKSGEVRSKSGEGYFVLAGEPFDEIKSGEKTTEYRDITPRNLSMSIGIRTVKIQRGYGHPGQPPAQMRFEVQSVGFLDANKCECDPYDIPEGFIATTIAIHLGKRIE